MSWFKLDDSWLTNPKVRRIGKDGRALWIAGGLHCAQHLTDGVIDKGFVPLLATLSDVKPGVAAVLVREGLWIDHGSVYEMHQYLDFQPSKSKVLAERDRNRERQARHRHGGSNDVSNGVTRIVTDGVSNDAPTRPDPTRPVRSEEPLATTDDDRDCDLGSSSSDFDSALMTIARAFALKSKRADDPESYARGIAKVMRSERGEEITELLRNGLTAEEVAAKMSGSATYARKAARGPLKPKQELSYLDRQWGAA